MTLAAVAILGFVTLQRLAELWIARRNTIKLLARGAVEHGRDHYPLIVGLHGAWLASLWWLAPGRPVDVPLLALFGLLQIGRIWVIASLAGRWTTRIIVLPGEPPVRSGPYRFLRHPNYAIVVAEIALLPLVFGLWRAALLFTLANAAVLWIRIAAEERALGLRA